MMKNPLIEDLEIMCQKWEKMSNAYEKKWGETSPVAAPLVALKELLENKKKDEGIE